jgi:hypothetical protein
MRITINTDIMKKYDMAGAIVWAVFEKILHESNWTPIKVSQICLMTDKVFSETPIKVAIRKMEADELIERMPAAADGSSYRFGINSALYSRKPLLQREQRLSPLSSSLVRQDIASEI